MRLDAAVAVITAEFPQASGEAATDDCLDITSGGLRADRDSEPALWASRELACAAFLREALAALRERKPGAITLLDGPHMDKWNITVMDSKGTHRTAEPRWSVTAKIGVINIATEGSTQ